MIKTKVDVRISGVVYLVLHTHSFEHNGDKREFLTLRRPKGRRLYYATRYGNGALSEAV